MPLSKYINQVERKFEKYVPYTQYDGDTFAADGALFKENNYNNYCFLYLEKCGNIKVSFFNCDYSDFSKIEDAYVLDSVQFSIENIDQLKIIIDTII